MDAYLDGKIDKERMTQLLRELGGLPPVLSPKPSQPKQEAKPKSPPIKFPKEVKKGPQSDWHTAYPSSKATDPFNPDVTWKSEPAPLMPSSDLTAAELVSGAIVSLVSLALNPSLLKKRVEREIGPNPSKEALLEAFGVVMARISAIDTKTHDMVVELCKKFK